MVKSGTVAKKIFPAGQPSYLSKLKCHTVLLIQQRLHGATGNAIKSIYIQKYKYIYKYTYIMLRAYTASVELYSCTMYTSCICMATPAICIVP